MILVVFIDRITRIVGTRVIGKSSNYYDARNHASIVLIVGRNFPYHVGVIPEVLVPIICYEIGMKPKVNSQVLIPIRVTTVHLVVIV